MTSQAVLAPGRSVTLFETGRPGRITSLRLGPAAAFAGDLRRFAPDEVLYKSGDVPQGAFVLISLVPPGNALGRCCTLLRAGVRVTRPEQGDTDEEEHQGRVRRGNRCDPAAGRRRHAGVLERR